jgi:hypothetical protein
MRIERRSARESPFKLVRESGGFDPHSVLSRVGGKESKRSMGKRAHSKA